MQENCLAIQVSDARPVALPAETATMQTLNQRPFTASRPIAGGRRVVRCHAQARPTDAPIKAAAGAAALSLATTSATQAAEILSSASGVDGSLTFALGGGVAIAGLGALLVATDPQKRYALL